MTGLRPPARFVRRASPLLAALLLAAGAAGGASGHAYLLASVPADGGSLRASPGVLRLQFDENVSSALSSVTLVGTTTGRIPLRLAAGNGTTLSAELPRLGRGLYRVEWRAVAEDDLHPTGGTLTFGIRTAAVGTSAAPETVAPGASTAEVAFRWLDFAGVAVVLGALAALLHVLPAAERRGARGAHLAGPPLRRLGLAGAAAAVITGFGLILMQVERVGGLASAGRVLGGTTYGHAWLAREALLVLFLWVFVRLGRRPWSDGARALIVILAVALVVSLAVVSHAASIEGAVSGATAILAVHLLAAGIWVGGVVALCVTTRCLIRAGERASARTAALSFGEPAALSAALLAVTGLAVLGIHVRSLDGLTTTGYGRVLLAKTALFVLAGTVGLATTVGLRVGWAPGRLRAAWAWAPRAEAGILVAVLLAAAVLTAGAPARQPSSAPRAAPSPVTGTTMSASVDDLVLTAAVDPNRPGLNFITVKVINTRRPAPAPIRRVVASLTQRDGSSRRLRLVRSGGEWQSAVRLSAGNDRLVVDVERPSLPTATATSRWRVRSVPPPTAAPLPGPTGLSQRPLEPILAPVAGAGVAALLLVLLVRLARLRLRALTPEPQLRKAER